MIIQKKFLIIVVAVTFLCSGLAHCRPQKAEKILSYIASLYMPTNGNHTAGQMTFGNELLPNLPGRTIYK